MLKVTFDTNCLIDLENGEGAHLELRELVARWRSGRIDLAVVAISASENQQGGRLIEDFSEFKVLLERVGLAGIECLPPLFYWDVGFWDLCLWLDSGSDPLEDAVSAVLFPGFVAEKGPSDPKALRVWRNKLCDIQLAWAHAYHQRDALVTRDDNFLRKRVQLASIGVKGVTDAGTLGNV